MKIYSPKDYSIKDLIKLKLCIDSYTGESDMSFIEAAKISMFFITILVWFITAKLVLDVSSNAAEIATIEQSSATLDITINQKLDQLSADVKKFLAEQGDTEL